METIISRLVRALNYVETIIGNFIGSYVDIKIVVCR